MIKIRINSSFIKEKVSLILNNSFTKGVLIISSGSVATQALGFIFSPIITRIFPPGEYGLMSLFASIVAVLSIISSFNYEMALPIVKGEKKAKNLLALCILLLTAFSFALLLVFLTMGNKLLSILNAEELTNYKGLLTIGIFLYGLREIFMQWFYRKKDFSFISKVQVSQSLLGNISMILFGVMGFGPVGLIAGRIIKDSFGIVPFSTKIIKEEKITNSLSKEDIKSNIKRYKNYPIYQTPSTFLSILKNQLPVFSLAFYGSSIVGLYGLANTIVKIPMTLLGHSIRNVFFAEAASIGKENPQKIKNISNSIFKKLAVLGLIPLIILLLFGPYLFSFVFGPEWEPAGHFSRFLAFSVYADFICSPISRIYEIFERQKERLFIDIFGLLIVLSSFVLARILSPDPNLAILFYTIAMCIYLLVIFIVANILINREVTNNKRQQ